MILYFNKILEFAYGVSSAINSDNPYLTPCHVTEYVILFFNQAIASILGKKFRTWGIVHVALKCDLSLSFFLWTLTLAETYGHIL